MAQSIFDLLILVADAVSSWFFSVFNASGMTAVFLGMVAVVASVRLLLHPLAGRASDWAFKKSEDDD